MVRPSTQQISLSKWWGPRRHMSFPQKVSARSWGVKPYACAGALGGLLWCAQTCASVCMGGVSFFPFFNEQDVDSNLMIFNIILGWQIEKCHFFENGKYLAIKLVSETLCITKYLNHRTFVSFAARRDIQGHSEVQTQMLSSRARTRTQAFGVPFSWSFWYTTMPSLDYPCFKPEVGSLYLWKAR